MSLQTKIIIKMYLFFFALLGAVGASAMPMLVTDLSGNVTGATGFIVDGTSYSMEFKDGTCVSLYNGCDEDSDFKLGSVAMSDLSALFFTMFIAPLSPASGASLDATPRMAIGCTNPIICITYTPIDIATDGLATISTVTNWAQVEDMQDHNGQVWIDRDDDTARGAGENWAVWSASTAAPEPGTLALLALGIAGLLYVKRKVVAV